jgi:hypothetical protein
MHTKSPGDLHRLVALTRHNPDANATTGTSGAARPGPILTQPEGRSPESVR